MISSRISVLLPVRDEQRYLSAALKSLSRQTFTDWELVAVDDGSQDRTPEILAAAAHTDPRIRIFTTPAKGLVSALNYGLEQCRTGIIARMDADDICHPQRLELQYEAMSNHPELDLVSCRVRHFPRTLIRNGMRAYEDWQNALLTHEQILRNLFVESPFAHPSVMFRKELVANLGGYRDMPWAEDYDLWLRLVQAGAKFSRLPQTLFFWRDRPERLSRTAINCSQQAFRNCKVHFLLLGPLVQRKEVWLWGAGPEGKTWRKLLQEKKRYTSGWIDVDKNKVGQCIHDAQVIAPEEVPQNHPFILVCVGTKGARQRIRDFFNNRGEREGTDYLCVT